jgi:hypothetical protein
LNADIKNTYLFALLADNMEKLTQHRFIKLLVPAAHAVSQTELAEWIGLPDAPPAVAAAFAALAGSLARAKTQLDSIPPDRQHILSIVDLLHAFKKQVRTQYNMQQSTNASLKMYELLGQLAIVPAASGRAVPPNTFRVFCNAELPGAFVIAINHYMQTMHPKVSFSWVASSYLPQQADGASTLLDDVYGLYAGNRAHWLMGPPPNALPPGTAPISGDVTDAAVVRTMAAAVARVQLYTSVAGIDASADYNQQEIMTVKINYGQVLAGLLTLAPGGMLITKQFTFFEPISRSLIGLLAVLFNEVYVCKPQASRPTNSEVYLVGRGFRGIAPVLATALLQHLERNQLSHNTMLMPPELLTATGIDAALLRIATTLHTQQVAFLNEVVRLNIAYPNLHQLRDAIAPHAARFAAAWLVSNPMRRIGSVYHLAVQ